MKVAILCSDDPHHNFLVALLCQHFNVVGVVVESSEAQLGRLWKKKLYINWIYRHYHSFRRRINGHSRYRQAFFATDDQKINLGERIEVEWINSQATIAALKRWQPDVTVVCGTGVIGQKVLAHVRQAFNIHGGVLPEYKGNHGVFFAFAESRYDLIGATIHNVSSKLDSGSIVEIVRPPIYPHDNDETLYCRADYLAMLRLVSLLKFCDRGGELKMVSQEKSGRVFRHRDRTPSYEFRLWLRLTLGWQRVKCIPQIRISTTVSDKSVNSPSDLVSYTLLKTNYAELSSS